jgi:hypothetical protein
MTGHNLATKGEPHRLSDVNFTYPAQARRATSENFDNKMKTLSQSHINRHWNSLSVSIDLYLVLVLGYLVFVLANLISLLLSR